MSALTPIGTRCAKVETAKLNLAVKAVLLTEGFRSKGL